MMFTDEIIEMLGHYVYLYCDPDSGKPFYVGKGQGNRVFTHLRDSHESAKAHCIAMITKQGKEPKIEILRYGLSDRQAALIESSVIDLIGIENLSNRIRGSAISNGRISMEDLIREIGAKEADIKHNVLLIRVNKSFRSEMPPEELYEITRGIWRIGNNRKQVRYAFAVFRGIVREVFEIHEWYPAGTLPYRFRDAAKWDNSKRWEFSGRVADQDILNLYKDKSVRSFFPRGNQSPFTYVWGSQDRETGTARYNLK